MANIIERVLCVYSTSESFTKEDLDESSGLKVQYTTNMTYDDLFDENGNLNAKILKDFSFVVDCTNENKVYEKLSSYAGKFKRIKEFGYDALSSSNGRVFIKGLETSSLILGRYANGNKVLVEQLQKNMQEHINLLKNIANKYFYSVKNRNNFQQGIETTGIDFTSFVNSGMGKRYVLVNELPEVRENGVEYITPEGIRILMDLVKISNKIS